MATAERRRGRRPACRLVRWLGMRLRPLARPAARGAGRCRAQGHTHRLQQLCSELRVVCRSPVVFLLWQGGVCAQGVFCPTHCGSATASCPAQSLAGEPANAGSGSGRGKTHSSQDCDSSFILRELFQERRQTPGAQHQAHVALALQRKHAGGGEDCRGVLIPARRGRGQAGGGGLLRHMVWALQGHRAVRRAALRAAP